MRFLRPFSTVVLLFYLCQCLQQTQSHSSSSGSQTPLMLAVSAQHVATAPQCHFCQRVFPSKDREGTGCNSCPGYEARCAPGTFEMQYSCHSFTLLANNGTWIQANCKNQATRQYQVTNISLDPFLGYSHSLRDAEFGGSGISQSCTWHKIWNEFPIVLRGTCNDSPPLVASVNVDLNMILANEGGQLTLIAPVEIGQPTRTKIIYDQHLPLCNSPQCAQGFKIQFTSTNYDCVSCNETDTLPGQYCSGNNTVAEPCREGFHCLGGNHTAQLCRPGCDCPRGASVECPTICAAGRYCNPGEPSRNCPSGHYCPEGLNSEPLVCDPKCACSEGSTSSCPAFCPPGRICKASGLIGYCPIGHWCNKNIAHECSSGTYSTEFGQADPNCSGQCGFWWTSAPGSLSCHEFSVAAMFIAPIIGSMILVVALTSIGWVGAKLHQADICGDSEAGAEAEVASNIEADVRSLIQGHIRTGIDALTARVLKQSFPSVLTLTSALMPFQIATVEQIQSGIKVARQELTDHMKDTLMRHPRLRYDDETYPWKLPLWAEVDPTSEDGELALIAASNTVAGVIRTAVENDLLDWFKRQHAAAAGDEVDDEDAARSLLDNQKVSSDALQSRWPAVDSELKIALRTVLVEPTDYFCGPGLRLAYSRPTPLSLYVITVWNFFQLSLDIVTLVACFLGLLKNLVTIEVPVFGMNMFLFHGISDGMSDLKRDISWGRAREPEGFNWSRFFGGYGGSFPYSNGRDTVDAIELFQPVLEQCTSIYGHIYFVLLIFSVVIFFIVGIASFVNFFDPLLQLSYLGRGCSLATGKVWTGCVVFGRRYPKFSRSQVGRWFSEGQGTLPTLRFFGMLSLVSAVAVFYFGCIVRLNHAPLVAALHQNSDPSEMWDYTAPAPAVRDLILMKQVEYSIRIQDAFIVGIIAAALAILPAAIAIQQACRKTQNAIAAAAAEERQRNEENAGAWDESRSEEKEVAERHQQALEMQEPAHRAAIHPLPDDHSATDLEETVVHISDTTEPPKIEEGAMVDHAATSTATVTHTSQEIDASAPLEEEDSSTSPSVQPAIDSSSTSHAAVFVSIAVSADGETTTEFATTPIASPSTSAATVYQLEDTIASVSEQHPPTSLCKHTPSK